MGTYLKFGVGILIFMCFITFGVKNHQMVTVNYYFDAVNFQVPLYALIYIAIFLGIVVGMLVGISKRLGLKRANRTLEHANRKLKEEIHEVAKTENSANSGPN
jgi:uncharacterized integral membrane protein